MPQASEELRARWSMAGENDSALPDPTEALLANFTLRHGVYRRKSTTYQPTDDEWSALQYLIFEWDYDYEDDAK